MKNKKVKRDGFTLIELLVVIAIMGILAAILVPNVFKSIEKSRISEAEADYKAIKTGVLCYYSDTGSWPANPAATNINNDPGLVSVSTKPAGWDGPYIESWKSKNAWGGNYEYHVSGMSRYITLTNVPTTSITKIDQDIDGNASGTDGIVIYSDASKGKVDLIISKE